MQPRSTDVDGIPMSWMEHGAGLPVVLVHGIPTSPLLWRHVVPKLRGARCIAWEMIGYGSSRSQGRDRDISVARQADYLAAFLDAQGISQAVFAGHDLGGGVVQILAVRRPDLCAGLMLTNSIGYDSWPIPSVKAMRVLGGLVRRLPAGAIKFLLSTLLAKGHETEAQASEAMQVHGPHYAGRDGAEALIRQVRSLDVNDTLSVSDRLKGLQVPACIVWGAADPFQKIKYGERFARDLSAPLERIATGKHFTPEDHPDAVANGIERVLQHVANRQTLQGGRT
ncbi:MAG: alpha/beta hydrolase [Alphaproteobacteria bacterium]|nr:alpha/beta hydrolase [Alphaproteobacteria bacterium]